VNLYGSGLDSIGFFEDFEQQRHKDAEVEALKR
jgi:hypothetical protein